MYYNSFMIKRFKGGYYFLRSILCLLLVTVMGSEVWAQTAGICGRTQQVRDAIVSSVSGITDCADITATHLRNITGTLNLLSRNITTLQAGDFAGLTALTGLWLQNNRLSSLPAGVFDELTALTSLTLTDNQLSSLPAGVFDELTALIRLSLDANLLSRLPAGVFAELTALTVLRLDSNQLGRLPAGVFAGLTRLDALLLQGNPVDPLPLPVSIVPTVMSGQVRATIPSGAPFALTLPVTVTNGTTTATTVTIAIGATESTAFTITRTDASQPSAVDLGTLPGLPTDTFPISGIRKHQGYHLVKADLPLQLFAPGVTISPTRLSLVEGSSGSYTVRLNDLPTGNVTVTIASDNTDVTASPGALTFTNSDWATAQTVTVTAGEDDDALNDTAVLSHGVSGYGSVDRADDVTVAVTDWMADVNGDNSIDAEDAIILFYVYELGDTPEVRNLLRPRLGSDDLDQAVSRATAWQRDGRAVGGDLNGDGPINQNDALIMYYAYEFGDLLDQSAVLRQLLLNGVRGRMPPTDATYRELLRRARGLQ